MKRYTELQEGLAIICPHCDTRLMPSRSAEQNIYGGGPFICGNCKGDVTETAYGKPVKKSKN